jgi:hypothetical protein
MARTKQYVRWAIEGECGLYVGQCLTKAQAIAEHVATRDKSLSAFAPLDMAQRERWRKCKVLGDRAVKIKITIL